MSFHTMPDSSDQMLIIAESYPTNIKILSVYSEGKKISNKCSRFFESRVLK